MAPGLALASATTSLTLVGANEVLVTSTSGTSARPATGVKSLIGSYGSLL